MKTPEESAANWYIRLLTEEPAIAIKAAYQAGYEAAKDQYAAKLKEANDTIAGMADECEGLKTIIYDNEDTNLPTPAKWISVKERLPENEISVLAMVQDGMLVAAYKNNGWNIHVRTGVLYYWKSDLCCEPTFNNVTHWQPLPEPPKEGK